MMDVPRLWIVTTRAGVRASRTVNRCAEARSVYHRIIDDVYYRNHASSSAEAGVGLMLDAGSNLDHLKEHLDICEEYNQVYTATGAHPHQALEFKDLTVADILHSADNDKEIAIGEPGLDYYYDFAPKEAQIELFQKNIVAAQESGLPLIIHNRDSDEDMIRILREAYEKKEFKAIIHC